MLPYLFYTFARLASCQRNQLFVYDRDCIISPVVSKVQLTNNRRCHINYVILLYMCSHNYLPSLFHTIARLSKLPKKNQLLVHDRDCTMYPGLLFHLLPSFPVLQNLLCLPPPIFLLIIIIIIIIIA